MRRLDADDLAKFSAIMVYDPERGTFRRRAGGRGIRSRFPGRKHPSGYVTITVKGTMVLAHRLAWAMHYGEWPEMCIDHINGCRSDNRICNLREASHLENNRNCKLSSRNTSGYKGVSWREDRGKWRASIRVNGAKVYLGYFKNAEDAYKAYCDAAMQHFGQFAHPG